MTTTDNLGLNLPESNDYADISKINENFTTLDAQALKAQAAKATPVDADKVPVIDSADASKTKLILWSAIKTALGNVFAGINHASRHKTGGADPIAPADIGAAAASHNHTKSQITDFPAAMAPTAHKSTHATGGADALTAADVGAAAVSHSHGNMTNDGQIGGVTLDTTLVRLVSGALQTLGGESIGQMWVKLAEFSSASGNPVNIDLSSSVWDRTKYGKLKISFDVVFAGSSGVNADTVNLRINSSTRTAYSFYYCLSGADPAIGSGATSIPISTFTGTKNMSYHQELEIDYGTWLDTNNFYNACVGIVSDYIKYYNVANRGKLYGLYYGDSTSIPSGIFVPSTLNLSSTNGLITYKNITLWGCK